MINFEGFKNYEVLVELWNFSKDAPYFVDNNIKNDEIATIQNAKETLKKTKIIDFFCGRSIKVSFLSFPRLDGMLYNRDNFPNTLNKVLSKMKNEIQTNQEKITIADCENF